jgi:hypothetical protein
MFADKFYTCKKTRRGEDAYDIHCKRLDYNSSLQNNIVIKQIDVQKIMIYISEYKYTLFIKENEDTYEGEYY